MHMAKVRHTCGPIMYCCSPCPADAHHRRLRCRQRLSRAVPQAAAPQRPACCAARHPPYCARLPLLRWRRQLLQQWRQGAWEGRQRAACAAGWAWLQSRPPYLQRLAVAVAEWRPGGKRERSVGIREARQALQHQEQRAHSLRWRLSASVRDPCPGRTWWGSATSSSSTGSGNVPLSMLFLSSNSSFLRRLLCHLVVREPPQLGAGVVHLSPPLIKIKW